MVMPRSSLFHSIATRCRFGTACLMRAKRLVESVVASSEMPVMLPPGRANESMRLVATGSPPPKATTVGTFACLQASTTIARGDDHIDLLGLELAHKFVEPTDLTARPAGLQRQVFAQRIAALFQCLEQGCAERVLLVDRRPWREGAEPEDFWRRLRERRARAGNRR